MPIVYSRALQQRLLAVNRAKNTGDKLKTAVHGFSLGELKPSFPGVAEPRTGMSMGDHCELMAREWKITRQEQDQLALASHLKAVKAAYERGILQANWWCCSAASTATVSCARIRPWKNSRHSSLVFDKTSGFGAP